MTALCPHARTHAHMHARMHTRMLRVLRMLRVHARMHTRTLTRTHAREGLRLWMKEDPVHAAGCGACWSGNARAAVHGRAVGQPAAPLGPAWAGLGILWHRLHCHPVVTCAARLSTGTGVRARVVLGGRLAKEASMRPWRCAVTMMLCYEAAPAASAARRSLSYVTKKSQR